MPYQTIGWRKNNNNNNNNNHNTGTGNFHQSISYHSIQNNNGNNNDNSPPIGISKSINNLSDGLIENPELIEKLFPKCRPKSKTTATSNNNNAGIDDRKSQMDQPPPPPPPPPATITSQHQQQLKSTTTKVQPSDQHQITTDQQQQQQQSGLHSSTLKAATPLNHHHHAPRTIHHQHRNIDNVHSKRIWNFMGISPSPSPPPLSPIEDVCLAGNNGGHGHLPYGKDSTTMLLNRKSIQDKSIMENNDDGDASIQRSRRSNSYDTNSTATAKFRLDSLLLSPDGMPNENSIMNIDPRLNSKDVPRMPNDDYDLNDEDDILFSRTNMEMAIMNFAKENKRSTTKINNDAISLRSTTSSTTMDNTKSDSLFFKDQHDDDDEDGGDENDHNNSKQHQMIRNHLAMAGGKELFSSSRSARSKKRANNNHHANKIQNKSIVKNNKFKSSSLIHQPVSATESNPVNDVEDIENLSSIPVSMEKSPLPSVGASTSNRPQSKQVLKDCSEDTTTILSENINIVAQQRSVTDSSLAKHSNVVGCYHEETEKLALEDHDGIRIDDNGSSQHESLTRMALKDDISSGDIIIQNPLDTIECATIELDQSRKNPLPKLTSHQSEANNDEESDHKTKIFSKKINKCEENPDSDCERFAIDLKNKLRIVSKNNNNNNKNNDKLNCEYVEKEDAEEMDSGSESDHSLKSGFSKRSFDEPIARLIGSVPIAQYEGSPKRYGPKPGYPKRIITNNDYETVLPSKEQQNTVAKSTALSSENGSPNSSSTSATFSSTDVHSSSSFSCPSNRVKPIEPWNNSNIKSMKIIEQQTLEDGGDTLEQSTNRQLKNMMIYSSPQMISCDDVVKSILNIPLQSMDSETDDAKSSSKTSSPLKSGVPCNNIAVLNLIHTAIKKESSLSSSPSRDRQLLNSNEDCPAVSMARIGKHPPRIGDGMDVSKNLKSNLDSESGLICSQSHHENEPLHHQYGPPTNSMSTKSVRSNSVGCFKQTSQTSFESTDSNVSERYSYKEYIRTSNMADGGGYHKHLMQKSNNNGNILQNDDNDHSSHNDLLRAVDITNNYLNNKTHKLDYIGLSPEMADGKELLDSFECLAEREAVAAAAAAASSSSPFFDDKTSNNNNGNSNGNSNNNISASSTVFAADGTIMLNIMPVLEDGLSSGMPSSDELEYEDDELMCDNDNESTTCLAGQQQILDDYVNHHEYQNHGVRTVIGCETTTGIGQNNVNGNQLLPPSTSTSGSSAFNLNSVNSAVAAGAGAALTGMNGGHESGSFDYYHYNNQSGNKAPHLNEEYDRTNNSGGNSGGKVNGNQPDQQQQQQQQQQPVSQTYFSGYNKNNSKYGRDVINNNNNPDMILNNKNNNNRIDDKDVDGSGHNGGHGGGDSMFDASNYYHHPQPAQQPSTVVTGTGTVQHGHDKYCLSSQQQQHSRPNPMRNSITGNSKQQPTTTQCNQISSASMDSSTSVGSQQQQSQYHHSYHHYYHHHHGSGGLGGGGGIPQPHQYPNLSNSPTLLSPNSPGSVQPHNASSASSSSSSSSSHQHHGLYHKSSSSQLNNQLQSALQTATTQPPPQQQSSATAAVTNDMQTPNSSSSIVVANVNNSIASTAPNIRHHHDDDCDTDQETDRLLGSQRTTSIEERAFFDEKNPNKRSNTSREARRWEPKVLIEGVLFRARYLGSTQLVCDGQPTKATRMMQAEEAVSRIKAPEGSQPSTEVDLFISTEKIMVLNTDLKEIMMDHALRTISYIADIGDLLVLMARRRSQLEDSNETAAAAAAIKRTPKMICHVFESEEAQYIAQSIGQAFQVAYMEFLKANGIKDSSFLKEMDYQEVLNSQEIFGDELEMFSKREKQKEVIVPKQKGEILGIVIVESGWGSMLPTVVIANLAQNSPSARCGQLNIGDQIIAINGISLVGLPLSTCQNYVKNTKNQTAVKFTIVPCPPVVEVKIKRPDTKYQLGFSVQNGVICSLLRGGIAERGGVRVGHRIIEINGQSVVAVPHDRIVNLLATSVGEIHMKTMPTSMFRLLTGQESPSYM